MSGSDVPAVILGWWRRNLRPTDDTSAARALRARLRRAAGPEAPLAEEAVYALTEALPWLRARPVALATLARVLAEVEAHDPATLAARFGRRDGPDGARALSDLRFQRLLRTPQDGLATALRRALPLAGKSCNVGRLGRDLLNWDHADYGERTRTDWCFDYFNAARAPAAADAPGGDA